MSENSVMLFVRKFGYVICQKIIQSVTFGQIPTTAYIYCNTFSTCFFLYTIELRLVTLAVIGNIS